MFFRCGDIVGNEEKHIERLNELEDYQEERKCKFHIKVASFWLCYNKFHQ